LEELTHQDERVNYFSPWGLGMELRIEESVSYVQQMIAPCDLAPAVPQVVRDYFDAHRELHTYGCFNYKFFTLAALHVVFTVELALKERLIPLRPGEARQIEKPSLNSLLERAANEGLLFYRDGDQLRGALGDYLFGMRQHPFPPERYDSEAIVEIRNRGAHPNRVNIFSPPDSGRWIGLVAKFVDHIWRSDPLLPLSERRSLIRAINDTFGKADEQAPYLFHGFRRAQKACAAAKPWGALLLDCFLQAAAAKQIQWPCDLDPSQPRSGS